MPVSFTGPRKYPRVDIGSTSVPVTLAGAVSRDRGHVTVMSAGGILADVAKPCTFTIGGAVELRFTPPGALSPLICSGVVRDIVPLRGLGIEFNQITPSDRESITQAVDRWLATY